MKTDTGTPPLPHLLVLFTEAEASATEPPSSSRAGLSPTSPSPPRVLKNRLAPAAKADRAAGGPRGGGGGKEVAEAVGDKVRIKPVKDSLLKRRGLAEGPAGDAAPLRPLLLALPVPDACCSLAPPRLPPAPASASADARRLCHLPALALALASAVEAAAASPS